MSRPFAVDQRESTAAKIRLVVARLGVLGPSLSVLALWLLFEVPTAFRPRGVDFTAIRPTGDFLMLLTAYAALRGHRLEASLRRMWFVVLGLLVFVRVDFTLCWLITRSRPLFYDQLFLLRHLAVLIGDLWSVPMALCLVLLALLVYGTVRLARALARTGLPLFAPPLRRQGAWMLTAAWAVVIAGTLARAKEPYVRWIAPELAANIRDSYRTYLAVQRGIVDSPYKAYANIALTRRPNVTFMFVESYGRIISDSPELTPPWLARLDEMHARLAADGWHMASGFSTAPVSGGRSWLAVGSIFMGTRLPYESVFRHLVREGTRLPSIPVFFADHGYDTIGLEPSDRVRPGVESANYYHLDRQIEFDDLHYKGPSLGWGLVPDQYSLGFAEENVLGKSSRPRFLLFHMVTSHMPWSSVPELVEDWHTLDRVPGKQVENAHDENKSLFDRADALSTRLRRYGREEMGRWVKYGGLGEAYAARYVATVNYDLSVIERHLLGEHADELVIVMGDHQPPAVAPDGENFDVPVHVFARDPALLAEFRERGFTDGLRLDTKARPAVEHAGLFSVVVRTLVRVEPGAAAPPPYVPQGVPLGG